MKITKSYLRQIIREAIMQEAGKVIPVDFSKSGRSPDVKSSGKIGDLKQYLFKKLAGTADTNFEKALKTTMSTGDDEEDARIILKHQLNTKLAASLLKKLAEAMVDGGYSGNFDETSLRLLRSYVRRGIKAASMYFDKEEDALKVPYERRAFNITDYLEDYSWDYVKHLKSGEKLVLKPGEKIASYIEEHMENLIRPEDRENSNFMAMAHFISKEANEETKKKVYFESII